jgi:DNA polymerase III alpha subunit
VFPQTLQQVQPLLRVDAALLVKGRVRKDETSRPKVIVSEVQLLEKAAGNGRKTSIRIRVDLDQFPENLLERIQTLLTLHPGPDAVLFELVRPGDFRVVLQPRRPAGVKADENLVAGLRALCGESAVELTAASGGLGAASG